MKLSIIRHGESLGNIRKSDIADCALSPLGEIQTERVKQFFQAIKLNRIYCSPLTRTLQTAMPLAEDQKLPIMLTPEMCEYFNEKWTKYGEYPWKTTSQLLHEYPICSEGDTEQEIWWPEWPETPEQAEHRVERFYQEKLSKHLGTEDEVVVFGHGHTTGLLRNRVHPNRKKTDIPGLINGVVFRYELDQEGKCLEAEVYFDHVKDCLSPKKNREY